MRELHDWFEKNRREFPWRSSKEPYRVWVSEVMLQQTRASVVIPYFMRWMEKFPSIESLAEAKLEEVIKAWEGLGYYSRARALHQGAKIILERFQGKLPSTREELLQIPGVGPYTAGAILSFGFQKKAVALDANAIRVAARLFCIEEKISSKRVQKLLVDQVEKLLDNLHPWVTTEALIELGALVCKPLPECDRCPLQKGCLGKEKALFLPYKKKREETIFLTRALLLLECEGAFLVGKQERGKVMADLYEFPYFEMKKSVGSFLEIKEAIWERFQIDAFFSHRKEPLFHSFTKYRVRLYPFFFSCKEKKRVEGFSWIEKEKLSSLPFSSGHRRAFFQ